MLTVALLFGSFSATVNASPVEEIPASEIETVYEQTVDTNGLKGWAQGPQIYSESGIVMDVDSGAILYGKNIHDPHYPASITKIATALIALQNYKMDEIVTFEQADVDILEYDYAHIGIRPGEELVMEDCMYAMLLASANEVSHAIGAHMEGGYEAFLEEMNAVAKELGCTDSNFVNTNGLHDPEHYTSAYDMALIGSALYEYEEFHKITTTMQYTIPATNLVNETRTFQQKHKMLNPNRSQYYEYCTGGKTGYTDQALWTLVTFAEKDGKRLVAVVMRTHGSGNSYIDTKAMLDYAFDNFSKVEVTTEQLNNPNISKVNGDSYVMLPSGVTFEQLECTFEEPTTVGDKVGKVVYTYEGKNVGSIDVTITDEYYEEIHGIKKAEEKQAEEAKEGLTPAVKTVIFVVVVLVGAVLIYLLDRIHKKNKIRKLRRQKRKEIRKRKGIE